MMNKRERIIAGICHIPCFIMPSMINPSRKRERHSSQIDLLRLGQWSLISLVPQSDKTSSAQKAYYSRKRGCSGV
jgi:hypothetical protein